MVAILDQRFEINSVVARWAEIIEHWIHACGLTFGTMKTLLIVVLAACRRASNTCICSEPAVTARVQNLEQMSGASILFEPQQGAMTLNTKRGESSC